MLIYGDGKGNEDVVDPVTNTRYSTSSFVHYLLLMMGLPYIIRHVDVSSDTDKGEIEAILSSAMVTGATLVSYSDNKIKIVWVEGCTYHDLKHARIENGPSLLKRLGAFFTATYVHGTFSTKKVSVKVTPVPPVAVPYHDGRVFMSRRLFELMLKDTRKRLEKEGKVQDVDAKIKELDEQVHNIRGLILGYLIKGDVIVVDNLEADLVIVDPDNNLKQEVQGVHADKVSIILTPRHQWGNVRLDRQTLSMLGDWLFDEQFLKNALVAKVDRYISAVRRGRSVTGLLPERDDLAYDAIASMEDRKSAFIHAMGTLNESVYLSQMNAMSVVKGENKVRRPDDRIKRYPVPFAVRMYLRNSRDYATVYGTELKVGVNEAHFTPFGIVLPDIMRLGGKLVAEAIRLQLRAHGGGDWDDNRNNHLRVAEDSDEFFDIAPGDIIIIGIRQPIGAVFVDGVLYVEFVINKVSKKSIPALLRHFDVESVDDIPRIRMANRPKSVMEIPEDAEPEWTPQGKVVEGEYDFDTLLADAQAAILSDWGYGVHADQLMPAARLGVDLGFFATEEDWIDTAKTGGAIDRQVLAARSDEDAITLKESGVAFDPYEAKRLGFYDWKARRYLDGIRIKEGIITSLVEFHKEEMVRFHEAAAAHLKEISSARKERAPLMIDSASVNRHRILTAGGKTVSRPGLVPALLARLHTEENIVRYEYGVDYDAYYKQNLDNETAKRVIARMVDAINEGKMTPERARAFVLESFLYADEAIVPAKKAEGGKVFTHGERLLFSKEMFPKLMRALEQAVDHEVWIPIQISEED